MGSKPHISKLYFERLCIYKQTIKKATHYKKNNDTNMVPVVFHMFQGYCYGTRNVSCALYLTSTFLLQRSNGNFVPEKC
jgi:hypothetical protein